MSKDRKEYFKNHNREYYLEHKEEILKKQKEYRTKNKEKESERHKKYNQKIKASNSILTELEEWLENNWKSTQDIWYVKIINKIKELKEKYK